MTPKRITVPRAVSVDVLTEAGYRCAVPTCRTIIAIDLHHIEEVHEGGGNDVGNLIALCPTCHRLYHNGNIKRESIVGWKGMLVALSNAFDTHALDDLIFLNNLQPRELCVSGDGVLKFSPLMAAGLAGFQLLSQNGPLLLYEIGLTPKGESFVIAWQDGDRKALEAALAQSALLDAKSQVDEPAQRLPSRPATR